MKKRREKIATAILAGLATQIDCSKCKMAPGITGTHDQDYIDKALELTDMLIAKLDENNDDSPLQSF